MSDSAPDQEFNPAFLMEQVGDDRELFDHLLNLFVTGYSTQLARLRNAVADNSSTHLYEASHFLLGEYLAIGHKPAAKTAAILEELGRSKSVEGAAALIEQLDHATQAILAFAKAKGSQKK